MSANIDWTDKNSVLEMVKENGFALQHASDDLRDDAEVVLAALASGGSLYFVSDRLKSDPSVALHAISCKAWNLREAPRKLTADRWFLIEAARVNGRSIRYAAKEFLEDHQILLTALRQIVTSEVKREKKELEIIKRKDAGTLEIADRGNKIDAIKTLLGSVPGEILSKKIFIKEILKVCSPVLQGTDHIFQFTPNIFSEDPILRALSGLGVSEKKLYAAAYREIIDGDFDDLLMGEVLMEAEGNIEQAKSEYIKKRVRRLDIYSETAP